MFISKETTSILGNENQLGFRLVKVADIIYTTIVSCIVVLVTLKFLQKSIFGWTENMLDDIIASKMDAPHGVMVFGLFCFIFSLFAVFAYLLRNFIELIPSPFHGMYGLNHRKLSEISDMSSLLLIILIVQTSMYSKLLNVLTLQ